MDLHIKDRLLIPSIFPERGNFMDFNLKKSIARKIAISEQDRKDYEIVEKKEEKRIEWNVQKDAETPLVDRKSTRLNSSHSTSSRMPSSA